MEICKWQIKSCVYSQRLLGVSGLRIICDYAAIYCHLRSHYHAMLIGSYGLIGSSDAPHYKGEWRKDTIEPFFNQIDLQTVYIIIIIKKHALVSYVIFKKVK